MKIEKFFEQFLCAHSHPGKALILGLSGGVDSLCLLHLLMKFPGKASNLHVAHVNHRWRPESDSEATQLEDFVRSLGLPFHLKTLDPRKIDGNLEDGCRRERFAFFIELAGAVSAQAVVLGHHADDQAETVLKRVLEGAPVSRLRGIQSVSYHNGIAFWRPLLQVPKRVLVDWMESKGYQWFEDATNSDTRFLRGRMRERLIPQLSRDFGKNIAVPLCRLGEEMKEVEEYLRYRVRDFMKLKICGPFGVCYDFSSRHPYELLEWKTLIRMVCEEELFPLSRNSLSAAVELMAQNKANKVIEFGGKKMFIDRRRIFFIEKVDGVWEMAFEPIKECRRTDWREVFQGFAEILVPEGKFILEKEPSHKIFQKLWSQHKIPLCVRGLVPVLSCRGKVVHEFLTGNRAKFGPVFQTLKLRYKKICC